MQTLFHAAAVAKDQGQAGLVAMVFLLIVVPLVLRARRNWSKDTYRDQTPKPPSAPPSREEDTGEGRGPSEEDIKLR